MASNGILWICTLAVAGIFLPLTISQDPCEKYVEIHEDERDISQMGGVKCDSDLSVGWYRFFIDNEPAILPTKCVKPAACNTILGMYANLKGASMPPEKTTISAVACASYQILEHWSCCVLQIPIKIRHCTGGFYIYHLRPTDRCPVSYCAVKNTTYIESKLTVRHGYHINYVETTEAPTTTQQIETTEVTDFTTTDYEDATTISNGTQFTEMYVTTMKAETTQKIEMSNATESDEEKNKLDTLNSSGSQAEFDETTQVTYTMSKSSIHDQQKATTVQSAVIPATTTRSVSVIVHTEPAELIFLLNGHDKEEVLNSFRANFTSAMQKANRNIHNITIKELCPIGDAIKILFWAYDTNGNIIPGTKVEENMEMRHKVEEALGLQPLPQRQDIFQEYLALFIILIIIGFLCLIILLSSCMYLYCRRHSGHWDRALAEQYHVTVVPRREALIAESPYSDEAIMSDEILEKSQGTLGSHYPGVGNLHDISYPNSLSGIKAMNNKNTFNTYPSSYGSLPKDGIEGLVVPIDQLKPEKDALIIEDTVL